MPEILPVRIAVLVAIAFAPALVSAQSSEGPAPGASGSAPAPAPAAAPPQPVGYGNYYGRPTVVGTNDPVRPAPAPRFRQFGSFSHGVPIVLDTNRELVRPGVNLYAAGGLDLGWIAFFLDGGFRWIPIDFDRAAEAGETMYAGYGRSPLKNFYFGPGIRLQVPNLNRLLPYVSGAFDVNFFNFREEAVACTGVVYWWCYAYDVWRWAPGFTGRLGLAVKVHDAVYVDVGAQLSMSFPGNFFTQNERWVEPFVGITGRR